MTDSDAVFSTRTREYASLMTDLARDAVDGLRRVFRVDNPDVFRVEIECRFILSTSEKQYNAVLGKLMKTVGSKTDPITSNIEDTNFPTDLQNIKATLRKQVNRDIPEPNTTWMIKHNVFPSDRMKRVRYFELVNYFQQRGLKFAVSIEFPKPESFTPIPGKTGEFKRIKNRVTLMDGRGKNQVQWDLTKVREQGSDSTKYEIELEKNVPLAEFNEEVVNTHLMGCSTRASSYVYSTPLLPIPVKKGTGSYTNNVALASQTLFEALSGRHASTDERIIPSIPNSIVPQVVNFQVQHILDENYQDYCITPKTDGYRYFMVVQEDHLVLIQPPNTFKVFARASSSPFPPGYIFDGELVFKENMIKESESGVVMTDLTALIDYVYYIFDVVQYPDGRTVGTLMERYLTIERELFPKTSSVKSGKMLINKKPYLSASSCPWDAVSQYFDEIQKTLHYKTDGLVFTPNKSTYRGLVNNKSLKWKPQDMLTMDLRYMGPDNQLFMFNLELSRESVFSGSKQHPITRPFQITKPGNMELIPNMIYEFLYIPSSNEMRVTRERYDKMAPNSSKVVTDVWNDVHNPISEETLKGEGSGGLRECRKEALWTWFQNICQGGRVVVDLSGIIPSMDFPVRFLDIEYQKVMAGCTFLTYSDPALKIFDGDIDVIILDGLMYDFLDGNIDDTLPITNPELFHFAHSLVARSKQIFVRGLPTHERDIIVETASLGHRGEVRLRRRDEKTVEIDSINLGIFKNFNTGTYDVPRVTSRLRSFPSSTIIVPAGNRVGGNFTNMGPDRILSGKLCGIWDYVVNALIPASHLRDNTTRMSVKEASLEAIISQESPEDPSEEITREIGKMTVVPEDILKTQDSQPLPAITIENKSRGDVFKCLAYGFFQMSNEIGREITPDHLDGHASELRLLYGNLSGLDLADTILMTFGLGIVWVYMLEEEILGATFPPFENGKPPKNGYMFIAPSLKTMGILSDDMTLITIGEKNDTITHPSSPLVANLMRRGSPKARFMTRSSKELTKILMKEELIKTEQTTSAGLEIIYESLPFRTRLTKAGKTTFTEEDVLEVVEKADIAKLKKTGDEILYDVNTTNTKNNILGYTLMKIRSGKLTKQK